MGESDDVYSIDSQRRLYDKSKNFNQYFIISLEYFAAKSIFNFQWNTKLK